MGKMYEEANHEKVAIPIDANKEFEMLSQGNTAEIYQYEDGKILKLFRDSFPFSAVQNEYRISLVVQNYLEIVPRVYELVRYQNRYGIIYEQICGEDMMKGLLKKPGQVKQYARKLAQIHASLHQQEVDISYSIYDKFQRDISLANELEDEEKKQIMEYLKTLPEGRNVCHMDFHPGNVMIRDGEPVVIDWMTACTGNANVDVARTYLLLHMGEVMYMNKLLASFINMFKQSLAKEYVKEYQRLCHVSDEEIQQWILPVAAARLSEWITEHERKALLKLIRSRLASFSTYSTLVSDQS